jgi:hypothetical protein
MGKFVKVKKSSAESTDAAGNVIYDYSETATQTQVKYAKMKKSREIADEREMIRTNEKEKKQVAQIKPSREKTKGDGEDGLVDGIGKGITSIGDSIFGFLFGGGDTDTKKDKDKNLEK